MNEQKNIPPNRFRSFLTVGALLFLALAIMAMFSERADLTQHISFFLLSSGMFFMLSHIHWNKEKIENLNKLVPDLYMRVEHLHKDLKKIENNLGDDFVENIETISDLLKIINENLESEENPVSDKS